MRIQNATSLQNDRFGVYVYDEFDIRIRGRILHSHQWKRFDMMTTVLASMCDIS